MSDVNDHSPKFYSQYFQEAVAENVPIGYSIVRIQVILLKIFFSGHYFTLSRGIIVLSFLEGEYSKRDKTVQEKILESFTISLFYLSKGASRVD